MLEMSEEMSRRLAVAAAQAEAKKREESARKEARIARLTQEIKTGHHRDFNPGASPSDELLLSVYARVGTVTEVARRLSINRTTATKRLKALGVDILPGWKPKAGVGRKALDVREEKDGVD